MKLRLDVGLPVYIVLKEGVIRGNIVSAMNRGQYSVNTFLGNVTIGETKIFKRLDFVKACHRYEELYGEKT